MNFRMCVSDVEVLHDGLNKPIQIFQSLCDFKMRLHCWVSVSELVFRVLCHLVRRFPERDFPVAYLLHEVQSKVTATSITRFTRHAHKRAEGVRELFQYHAAAGFPQIDEAVYLFVCGINET